MYYLIRACIIVHFCLFGYVAIYFGAIKYISEDIKIHKIFDESVLKRMIAFQQKVLGFVIYYTYQEIFKKIYNILIIFRSYIKYKAFMKNMSFCIVAITGIIIGFCVFYLYSSFNYLLLHSFVIEILSIFVLCTVCEVLYFQVTHLEKYSFINFYSFLHLERTTCKCNLQQYCL